MLILQSNARTSNAEIARRVGLAPSAIFERIRKLEEKRLITGFTAKLDARQLGFGLIAFVFVKTDERAGATDAGVELAAIPEVLEVHNVAGEDCYLVKVRVADTEALGTLLRERLGAIPSVRSTRTTIVLQTTKETSEIPLTATAEPLEASA
jgi:Lrp/AsnC family leucine-responsive transcriptional regulator